MESSIRFPRDLTGSQKMQPKNRDINWTFILPAAIASFAGDQAGAGIMSTRLKGKTIRVIFSQGKS